MRLHGRVVTHLCLAISCLLRKALEQVGHTRGVVGRADGVAVAAAHKLSNLFLRLSSVS